MNSGSIRRVAALVAVLAMTVTTLGAAAPAQGRGQVSAQDEQVVGALVGKLAERPAGLPGAGAGAARRLAPPVSVRLDRGTSRITATAKLQATPTAAGVSTLVLSTGTLEVDGENSTCYASNEWTTPTFGTMSAGFSRNGATIRFSLKTLDAYDDADCAFVVLTNGDRTTTYDALIGDLNPVYAKAKFKIKNVKLFSSKKIKLVPGVWTKLDVAFKNTSNVDATGVRITGKGKGVKVRTTRVGKVYSGWSLTPEVQVKLLRKKAAKIRFTVRSGTGKGSKAITVRPRKAPAKALAGKYRDKRGFVHFRIKNGKVVGFRIGALQTRCGGYPDPYTYTYNHYTFPTKRIGRNGIIDAKQKTRLFTVGLEAFAAGKKVTQAYFWYSGPNRCFASARFTAKRAGK